MKEKVILSIIVPTIGRKSLIQTLDSIVKQTYQDGLEIIVTDDTEDGKAKEIVESFKENYSHLNIIYSINKKYLHGPTGNKNNGLDLATGEFITFVDDDNILLPEAIEIAMKHISEKDLDCFLANCISSSNGKFTGRSYGVSEWINYYDFLIGKYEGEYFPVVKKDLLNSDRFPDDAWGAEFVLWYKIYKRSKKIFYLDQGLKIYNDSKDAADRVTSNIFKYPEKHVLNYYYIIKEFYDDFVKFAPLSLWRYAMHGIFFSKLSNNFKLSLYFLKISSKSGFFLSCISFIYFFYNWLLPKRLLIFIKNNLLNRLTPIIKNLMIKKFHKNTVINYKSD